MMRKKQITCALLTIILSTVNFGAALGKQSIVISTKTAGRTGDQILSFAKGRWVAWKNNMPFCYSEFPHAEKFMLSRLEKKIDTTAKLLPNVSINSIREINAHVDNTVWATHYYMKIPGYANLQDPIETDLENIMLHALDNPEFEALMQQLLQPVNAAHDTTKTYTIGIHYRSGYSEVLPLWENPPLMSPQFYTKKTNYIYHLYRHPQQQRVCHETYQPAPVAGIRRKADVILPTKFPPLQYYLDQLLFVCTRSKETPRIIICTDHPNKELIRNQIYQFLQSKSASFESIEVSKEDPMTDMLVLASCPILIRGNSNFARISQLMGNHALIVRPYRYTWKDKTLHINEVALDIRKNSIETVCNLSGL